MDLGLKGKTAIVTGGSRGIGRACAVALAGEGARVAIVGRDEKALAETQRLAAAVGESPSVVVADLSTEAGCRAATATGAEALGEVDILVNCAGSAVLTDVLDAGLATRLREALDLKFFGYLAMAQLLAPGMAERGWGRIVNIAGVTGAAPSAGNLPTSISNICVLNLTRALSDALSPKGVLVNAVCPGAVDTERLRDIVRARAEREGRDVDQTALALGALTPAGRVASADEVARVVAYLASPACTYVHGNAIYMDGGASRRIP